ncbi:hypothetical protein [Aureimonas sp. ME7]|uniref:D-apionate lactonase n=1 Tax=Aureimonas sp. ME7 TaxID=2744252 RepID=UPI0015F448F9|nr:hypothetical protein [Aureimonas sp. ME7]
MADPIKLTGTNEEPAPVRRLAAGRLSVELVSGNLRTIRFAGHEVIRAISYVVRDRDWGTYAPPIRNLHIEEAAENFRVSYEADCQAPDGARLAFSAAIEGRADGTLRFAVEALPDRPFETNRCGFCVLHPIEGVAGTPASVVHTDGRVEEAEFPKAIAPWQPFQDMREIAHEAAPGLRVRCRMEGDAFEMEDQRAWSDASYKTYVRPLALPWPYRMDAGVTDRQSVTLSVELDETRFTPATADDTAPIAIRIGEALEHPMPRFGLAVAPDEADAVLAATARLDELRPQFLLFHFDPLAGHGAEALAAFARIASHAPEAERCLELVVPGREAPATEIAAAAKLIAASGLAPQTVVVGPSVDRQSTPPGSRWPDCPPLEEVYRAAREAFPGATLGGGMFSYFTELNRKRVPLADLDFVTHATCPIVHAADDLSVMQTLEAIPFITRSTQGFIGSKPYRLGPTTIGMRQNPYGSRTMANPDGRRIAMANDDPRARGLFGAAWLTGYAARLAGSAVEAWTGASLAGARGLILGDGSVTPAFHVAQALAAAGGTQRVALDSSDRSAVDGWAARTANSETVAWLANLTPNTRTVRLDAAVSGSVTLLDEASFDAASQGALPEPETMGAELTLPPFAVARLLLDPQVV